MRDIRLLVSASTDDGSLHIVKSLFLILIEAFLLVYWSLEFIVPYNKKLLFDDLPYEPLGSPFRSDRNGILTNSIRFLCQVFFSPATKIKSDKSFSQVGPEGR